MQFIKSQMSKERAQFFRKWELVLSVRCFFLRSKAWQRKYYALISLHKICYNSLSLQSICSWNTKSVSIHWKPTYPHTFENRWDNLGGLLYRTSSLLFCLYLPSLTRQEHCRHFTHIQRAGKIMVITVLPANYWTHCSLLTMLKMRWQENWSSYMSLWLKGATDLSKCTNKVGIGSKARNVFQEMSNNWFADGRKRTFSSYPQEKSIKPTFSLG